MLVIMYSINVFLTFSLSMIGMVRHWWQLRHEHPWWRRRLALFLFGGVMCVSILCLTIYEKFDVGGWRTLGVTGVLVGLCFWTRNHYDTVIAKVRRLDETLGQLSAPPNATAGEVDPKLPTAVILVGGYSGLGVHTLLNAVRLRRAISRTWCLFRWRSSTRAISKVPLRSRTCANTPRSRWPSTSTWRADSACRPPAI